MGNWAEPNGIANAFILVIFFTMTSQIGLVHALQMTMNSIKPILIQVLPGLLKLDMVENKFYTVTSAIRQK